MPLEAKDAEACENSLRGRLGLLPVGVKLPVKTRRQGWVAAAIAALVAFVTRFSNLNHPHAIVFDETYYVKGAFSLLRKGYEGAWEGAEKATGSSTRRWANGSWPQANGCSDRTTASAGVFPPQLWACSR